MKRHLPIVPVAVSVSLAVGILIGRQMGSDRDGADIWLGRLPEADQAAVLKLSE